MASKNLGAVIQRAISDGAFRRQLQSDPAAALRGFNLSPDEVAAIRSGDSSKLMSLGVDQRMSKAFALAPAGGGAQRSSVSDLNAGHTASTIANDQTSGAREGIIGDPTSGSRQAMDPGGTGGTSNTLTAGDTASTSDAVSTGNFSGGRAIVDSAPFDSRGTLVDPTVSGGRSIVDSAPFDSRGTLVDPTVSGGRSIVDSAPFDSRAAASTGDLTGVRAVHDVAPFGTPGTSAIEDPNSPEFAARIDAGNTIATGGDYNDGNITGIGNSSLAAFPDSNAGAAGGAMISADDNYAVSSRMADANLANSIRSVNDVAPFEGNVNAAATGGSEFLGGDARLDPGTDSAHGFVPSDSADVQREMLDGEHGGDALGNTGTGHPS